MSRIDKIRYILGCVLVECTVLLWLIIEHLNQYLADWWNVGVNLFRIGLDSAWR